MLLLHPGGGRTQRFHPVGGGLGVARHLVRLGYDVTVTDLKGAHDRSAVQRSARESWGHIVRCYKQLGRRESGTLTVRLEISADGKVVAARRLGSTLNDEVSSCLASVLRARTMPGARTGSTATVELQLAPGDD